MSTKETIILTSKEKITKSKHFRLLVGPFMNNTSKEFMLLLNELYNATPNDTLELRIMSPGGLVREYKQLRNIIRSIFKDNCTTYIESHASSAGAFTFIEGSTRIVYETSEIMFHNYSGGYQGSYKKMKDRMEFDEKHLVDLLMSSIEKYFSKKEIKKIKNGKDVWLNAKQMCKRGIATHINIDGELITAKKYLKSLKKNKAN